jgi:hypothetical protein
MAIERLDGFTTLPQQILDGTRENRASREQPEGRPAEGPGQGNAQRVPAGDKVEISPKAHRLSALRHSVEQGLAALDGIPDIRADRVAEVRSRLDRGFYNSVEVRSRVAERLGGVTRRLEAT